MAGEVDVCFYATPSDATIREKPLTTTAEISSRPSSLQRSIVERPLRLGDASVLTFDVYGTLVDRETGIVTALMPWLHDVGVTAGRSEIVRAFSLAERANLVAGMRYRDVLVRAHDAIADFFGVRADPKAAEEFAGSIGRWPVHPDAPAALSYLRQHFQLVVLTNADHAAFEMTNQALGVEFDAVYTAEDTGTFKPSTGMFAHLLSRLEEAGIDRRQVLHVAGSIRFDHVPAKRLGINTCWIHRKRGPEPFAARQKHGVDVHPDFRFRTLGGLADTHWAEIREG
ncbi:MAG: HAD-IA family hydrolase [Rhizobiales bacterium]|nr:HAD-IA family hydrolase [Hyphomicrobiales bacterium]